MRERERERHQNGSTMVVVIWSSWSPISHLGSQCLVSLHCGLGYIYIALKERACSLSHMHTFSFSSLLSFRIVLNKDSYTDCQV